MTSQRMHISWSLNIEIQSLDDRKTALLDMAREWLSEVVCRRVVVRSEARGWLWEIIDNIGDSDHMTTDGSMPTSMMEEVLKGMERLPTPDSVQRQDQVEVGIGLLSLSTPDVCDGDQEMADMPDKSMLSNGTADVLDRTGNLKRKRSVCPGSERRRVINYFERQYYLNEEYYPTWRSYPLNKKRYT